MCIVMAHGSIVQLATCLAVYNQLNQGRAKCLTSNLQIIMTRENQNGNETPIIDWCCGSDYWMLLFVIVYFPLFLGCCGSSTLHQDFSVKFTRDAGDGWSNVPVHAAPTKTAPPRLPQSSQAEKIWRIDYSF